MLTHAAVQRYTHALSYRGLRRIRFGFYLVILLSSYLGLIGVLAAEKVISDHPSFTYIMIALVLSALCMGVPFKYWLDDEPLLEEDEPILNAVGTPDVGSPSAAAVAAVDVDGIQLKCVNNGFRCMVPFLRVTVGKPRIVCRGHRWCTSRSRRMHFLTVLNMICISARLCRLTLMTVMRVLLPLCLP